MPHIKFEIYRHKQNSNIIKTIVVTSNGKDDYWKSKPWQNLFNAGFTGSITTTLEVTEDVLAKFEERLGSCFTLDGSIKDTEFIERNTGYIWKNKSVKNVLDGGLPGSYGIWEK